MSDPRRPVVPRGGPFFVSVPFERRLLHLALQAGLVIVESLVIFALAIGLIVADLVSTEVAWKLAVGFASWLATITTALTFTITRFPKAPLIILVVHALAIPGSVLLFVVLNFQLILRLVGAA